ncbi:MAG: ATP-binding cassette domain-containing protein [Thiohalocapsa sp.]|jgi:ATP-binding cassette subfamily F protein uup
MPLISLQAVVLSYGAPNLLDSVDVSIESGERVCLLGRNGAGKSTLLRIVVGEVQPDAGEVRRGDGVRVARLAQEAPAEAGARVLDVVMDGLGALGNAAAQYLRLSHSLAASTAPAEADLARLAAVQQRLDAEDGWAIEQRAERVISRLGLDAEAEYAVLSGGLRRRVMLARALVSEPDLLLLDEPTNHLDVDTIEWLEDFLLSFPGSILFITHDRRFLRRLATRILELDRGKLTDWPGDYDNYLRRRAERDNAEAQARARFDKKLAEEEVWIRQGIKARRTRNEGRVRALEAMRAEQQARRSGPGSVRLRLDGGERSGKLVVEAEGVRFGYDTAQGDRPIIDGLDTLILRGDRVGIIGPNGAGKSTLLKLLLGELQPDAGSIRLGTNLRVAYFDQLRTQLDPGRSVRDNVAGGSDMVEVGGRRLHVLSYLKDFLFTPDRAQQPVSALSGGERNRLLLARLFTQPANLLVLDEPTNDLDAETLELLEDLLMDFDGTLLLVSHDRELLDNVVTSTLVLEGEGKVAEYVGGWSDWLRQRPAAASRAPASGAGAPADAKARPGGKRSQTQPTHQPQPDPKPKKLSYKDQRELGELPARLERLEAEQATLQKRLADPDLYRAGAEEVTAVQGRLAALEAELAAGYARWEDLEARQA